MTSRSWRIFALALGAVVGSLATAQSGSAEFRLGFGGAVVSDAWNPLSLVLRDVPAVELELVVDQGTLRSGASIVRYSFPLEASVGLRRFDDVLYVPSWSSLTWSVRSAANTIASGSVDPRRQDDRPLTLLVSARAGELSPHLGGEARPQEVAAAALPLNAAAYAGVEALLVDATAPPPQPTSLLAAAAAGATVVLIGPFPDTHASIASLAGPSPTRLGAGWIVSTDRSGLAEALRLPAFPQQAVFELLTAEDDVSNEPLRTRMTLTLAGAAYALLVLVLLRFGGDAAIPTALIIAALVTGAAWLALRPEQSLVEEERSVSIAAGGLALNLRSVALRSLPGGHVELASRARPAREVGYLIDQGGTSFELERWRRERFMAQPRIAGAELNWDSGRLSNRGEVTLRDVLVLGLGPQPELRPGEEIVPRASEEHPMADRYSGMLDLLPAGTALARAGDRILIALPETDS